MLEAEKQALIGQLLVRAWACLQAARSTEAPAMAGVHALLTSREPPLQLVLRARSQCCTLSTSFAGSHVQRHTEELAQAEESPARSGTSSRLEQVRSGEAEGGCLLFCGQQRPRHPATCTALAGQAPPISRSTMPLRHLPAFCLVCRRPTTRCSA